MYYKINNIVKELMNENIICFTMDTDWASDYAIKKTIDFFIENEITLTVFSTNPSKVIREYSDMGKIDVGIHPNFLNGSSQGNTKEEIIEYCMNTVPKTEVFRCHRWYADNDIYNLLYSKGFRYESNLCTRFEIVKPFIHRSGMISFPVFFEDGGFIQFGHDLDFCNTLCLYKQKGIKTVNFHPMHFMLNTPYFQYTRKIKDSVSRESWNSMDGETIEKIKYQGNGITDYMKNMVEFAQKEKLKNFTLKQLYQKITE